MFRDLSDRSKAKLDQAFCTLHHVDLIVPSARGACCGVFWLIHGAGRSRVVVLVSAIAQHDERAYGCAGEIG
jgi:hypothetical protein